MNDADYLRNQLLIAMPGMEDGYFDHSVTLLCEHSADGAMGVVINRPTDLTLNDMLRHMELEPSQPESPAMVYWGGPVQPERGFVLHSAGDHWESTLKIGERLFLTTSRDILEEMAKGKGPEAFLVMLGYAGWAAGQLEEELLHNSWLSAQSDNQIIFSTEPQKRWQAAIEQLGVDPSLLSSQSGHA